jgi:alkylhydroperoxidase/carboxymuconolactone decarboxylase family protein YurZ
LIGVYKLLSHSLNKKTMKKLLVAIAVVASIGVTLSKNNTSVKMNYDLMIEAGADEEEAMDVAAEAYFCDGFTLGEALEL